MTLTQLISAGIPNLPYISSCLMWFPSVSYTTSPGVPIVGTKSQLVVFGTYPPISSVLLKFIPNAYLLTIWNCIMVSSIPIPRRIFAL